MRSITPTTSSLPGGISTAMRWVSRGRPCAHFAEEAGLSPKYLATIWAALTEPAATSEAGPLGQVRAMWKKLPGDASKAADVRRDCERMRDAVVRLRAAYEPRVPDIKVRGISKGSQPFVLWRNRQLAAQRMRYDGDRKSADAPERERFCSPRSPTRSS